MQSSFFDLDKRYAHLSKTGDPQEAALPRHRLGALFRPLLDRIDDKPRKNNAGRKPSGRVLMFKMLVLQTKRRLFGEQLEY